MRYLLSSSASFSSLSWMIWFIEETFSSFCFRFCCKRCADPNDSSSSRTLKIEKKQTITKDPESEKNTDQKLTVTQVRLCWLEVVSIYDPISQLKVLACKTVNARWRNSISISNESFLANTDIFHRLSTKRNSTRKTRIPFHIQL